MTNITKAQCEMLARAAAEPGGVIDAPEDKLAKALIKQGLAISLPIDGGASRLIITEAGRAAIGSERKERLVDSGGSDDGATDQASAPVGAVEEVITIDTPTEASKPKKHTPSGKLGVLVELLQQPDGATLEAMRAATGWQAHSVRGAMSGSLKKGFGFAISSEKTDAGRVYKIQGGEAA